MLTAQDAIGLLEQMIATPSVSRSEDKVADLVFAFLHDRNIDVHRHYNNVWAMCRHYDQSKKTLLLNSHLDTVKPSSAYTLDPFQPLSKGDRLYGLGSNDAGASAVSLLTVFCNYYDIELPFNLLLLLGAEEEVMGEHGMREMIPFFQQHGINIDFALVGEPTGLDAAVGERGLVVLDAVAHGQQGHAARDEGVNAIYKALADIECIKNYRFEKVSPLLGDIRMTVTMIDAGTQHNVIPDTCHFVVDIRTTDAYTNEEVVDLLKASLESEVTPRSTRIRASAISEEHPLVQAAVRLGRKTYVSPTTSDMALMPFASLKLGVGQSCRSHSAAEYVLKSEIIEGVDFYNKYIKILSEIL